MDSLFIVQEGAIVGVTIWFWVLWFCIAWFMWSVLAAFVTTYDDVEESLIIGAMLGGVMTGLGLVAYWALLWTWVAFVAYVIVVAMVIVVAAIKARQT